MNRRTKIIATLGPATDDVVVLRDLILAGVDVVRLNFSHGSADDHRARLKNVREISSSIGKDVGVLGDLQGPKIRIERFERGRVHLAQGQDFVLDAELDADAGTSSAVGITYKTLTQDVGSGDVLLLDDGRISLEVKSVTETKVICTVLSDAEVTNSKGINRQGGGLSAAALTNKDFADIKLAAELGVDYLAVSFPRDANDVNKTRELLRDAGGHGQICAKIERAEAVDNIESIVNASDVVMVARGDLGVEMGYAELTGLQKRIIRTTRLANKIVITATQMMESMIHNPTPTRAEVSDVANAVMDGTDAVMLSGESATGEYPVLTVEATSRVCIGAEKHQLTHTRSRHRLDIQFDRTDEAIAMAVMYTANHLSVAAIIALTESGATALWMSRIRSDIPIFAFTRHETTRRRVTLYRGVYSVAFDVVSTAPESVYREVFRVLLNRNLVEVGDQVIFTKGELTGVSGGTNTLQILTVLAPDRL